MQPLKLPSCDLKIMDEEGNRFVFDVVRKKYVLLTPEEWVRQHFIHLMINFLNYPRPLIRVESGMNYFKSAKRSDVVVMDRTGQPFLLLECKAPEVKISKSTLQQASVYNKVVKAPYLAVTNGLVHFIWKLENGKYEVMKEFPELGGNQNR